jgi:hypothetical protein
MSSKKGRAMMDEPAFQGQRIGSLFFNSAPLFSCGIFSHFPKGIEPAIGSENTVFGPKPSKFKRTNQMCGRFTIRFTSKLLSVLAR